jgi:putative tricarboxylic transport membrane protein
MLNKTQDQKSGLFWCVAGAVIVYFSIEYDLGDPNAPGPGYIPFVAGICMMLLAIIMIARDARRDREKLSTLFQGKNWLRVTITILALLLYAILLPYIGFLIASVLLMYYLIRAAGTYGRALAATAAILFSAGCYFIFASLLQVALPEGLLYEWLQGRFLQ